uniref:TSA: Wollemia nobilis Ref_Wollemi_Transcript_19568_1893 transcribed RNA sequence n=1 Tax=Wollemia nobilis TaxID=56998 RepID=A0A0C9S2G6_9CONI
MAGMKLEMETELTSGASGRIIPVFRNLREAAVSLRALKKLILFVQATFMWIILRFHRRRRTWALSSDSEEGNCTVVQTMKAGKKQRRLSREEEDALTRRALAHGFATDCSWQTMLFVNSRRKVLFTRSSTPASHSMKGLLVLLHGLNEHSGRYEHFAKQLNSHGYGAYAMDWIGHGGSDGLHGFVPSLDHVVEDMRAFLEKVKSENPGVPCFLFGHSTGGAVVLKAASHPDVEAMVEGVILTSPALRVRPAHPIFGAIAPVFSLLLPKFQFSGANKRGIPVSRDPAALTAKYSDPLVYTGPLRIRTGSEILRITSYLQRNLKKITVPFFVLHGTADKVTDPFASQELYNEAASKHKAIKLYDGFLHDLLFEPERDDIAADIIDWMDNKLNV